jgi:hypothetical protein
MSSIVRYRVLGITHHQWQLVFQSLSRDYPSLSPLSLFMSTMEYALKDNDLITIID